MSTSNNSKMILSSLDFDEIKNNLKTYLKSQSEFQDFNFEGSALSQLLNLLAYNTHYLGFYMNMIANEMFLDTAVLRSSIVSHAKLLGYTPRSKTASQAVVNVAITKANTDSTTILTIPRFTVFTSEPLNGVSYNFVTVDSAITSNVGQVFTFNELVIKEGNPITKTYLVDVSTNPSQTFDLGDASIDTSTLKVVIQASQTNLSQETFELASDATDVNGDSNVYYLEQGQNGNYQIYFGDNILGKALENGNIVIVSYIITNGDEANGLKNFRLQTSLLSGSTSNVITAIASSAGSLEESAESVKFSAPKSYISQNRAVTVNDYINLINKKFPFFDAVNVWGGNENIPPVYGKVFITAKPKDGFSITQAEKQFVINTILQPIGVLTVIPEFVDADYNFLNFNINVFYNPKRTSSTASQISNIVSAAVASYAKNNLNKFNSSFKVSRLLRAIDDADPSIVSSATDIFIEKRFDPIVGTSRTYKLSFGTQLNKGIGKNRLYSTPTFSQQDSTGVERDCYFEETPDSTTGVEGISIINPGTGYTETPTILIEGDGTGANAYAVLVNGRIESVIVDKEGSNYTTATVLVTGGFGSGAELDAVIQGTKGKLRSYFFDQNNVKTILNHDAGDIDYLNGIITIKDFAPLNVSNPSQTLSIHIQPKEETFNSTLNRIITYDSADPGAISITVNVDTTD